MQRVIVIAIRVIVIAILFALSSADVQAQYANMAFRRQAAAPADTRLLCDVVAGCVTAASLWKLFETPSVTGTVIDTDVTGRSSFSGTNLDSGIDTEAIISLTDHHSLSDSLVGGYGATWRPDIDFVNGTAVMASTSGDNAMLHYPGADLANELWLGADGLGQDTLHFFLASYSYAEQVSGANDGGQIFNTQRHPDTGVWEILSRQDAGVADWGNGCVRFSPATGADVRLGGCDTAAAMDMIYLAPDSMWVIHEIVIDSAAAFSYWRNGLWADSLGTPGKTSNESTYNGRSGFICNAGQGDDGHKGLCTTPMVFDRILSASERITVRDSIANRLGFTLPDTSAASGDEWSIIQYPDTQWFVDGTHASGTAVVDSFKAVHRTLVETYNAKLVVMPGDLVDVTIAAEWNVAAPFVDTLAAVGDAFPVITMGNHDYDTNCSATRAATDYTTNLVQAADFTGHALWHANTTRADFYRDKHERGLFNVIEVATGDSLLVIGIEHDADINVLDWADSVAAAIDHPMVFVTHDFMDERGTLGIADGCAYNAETSGSRMADSLSSDIWMSFNGHHARGSATRRGTAYNDESSAYFFFDPMVCEAGGTEDCSKLTDGLNDHGMDYDESGFVRVITYSPSTRKVTVRTLSPWEVGGGGNRWRFLMTAYDYMEFTLDNNF